MKKVKAGSFKDYVNNLKLSPYNYLISNTEEFKKEEEEAGIEPTPEEKEEENSKSLLQYLLVANQVNR